MCMIPFQLGTRVSSHIHTRFASTIPTRGQSFTNLQYSLVRTADDGAIVIVCLLPMVWVTIMQYTRLVMEIRTYCSVSRNQEPNKHNLMPPKLIVHFKRINTNTPWLVPLLVEFIFFTLYFWGESSNNISAGEGTNDHTWE
ncbi:hypothetical protein B0T17DRAFT_152500 [Bombardia bombarda]|uniref:Uncharacterized protein n=1 Tax=Bombardia bombarda TaxID=252184 RepID=A0AA39X6V4_9PEZI|nr:hypothetical protein B0T17DRAFT_152500 [Bombardia bombarda]